MKRSLYGIFGLITVLIIVLALLIVSVVGRKGIDDNSEALLPGLTSGDESPLKISLERDEYEYTGQEIVPQLEVTSDGEKLTDGFEVSCENNIEIGIASVSVKAGGSEASAEFRIVPVKVKLNTEFRSTESTVSINWESADNCDYYLVSRSDGTSDKWETVKEADKAEKTCTDPGLKAASVYSYKVSACVRKDGIVFESPDSDIIKAMTAPEKPKPFSASGDGRTVFSWDKVEGAEGYEILVSHNKGETDLLSETKDTSFELPESFDENAVYYVRAYCLLDDKKIFSELAAVDGGDSSEADSSEGESSTESASDDSAGSDSEPDSQPDPGSQSKEGQGTGSGDTGNNSKLIAVKNILQNPELPTGCETTALTILLRHMGYDADKVDIARNHLPKLQFYTENGVYYGADFRTTFAGDPESEYSYGCYAPCIVTAANSYLKANNSKVTAHDATGTSFENILKTYIDKDKPVLIWVTSNNLHETKLTSVWTTPAGETVQWISYEHCVVLTGYDMDKKLIYVSDPLVGNTSYSFELIRQRYIDLGQQCVWLG